MARSLRDIRQKMKSIKATRQVTKAMELVAASKMRKAVQNALMLRRYALTAWEILQNIARANVAAHPYLTERPSKKVLAIVITSDRGLCGSLNLNICRAAQEYRETAKKIEGVEKLDYIAVGRKGQQFLARTGQNVIAAFPAFSNHPSFKDVLPVAKLASERFIAGEYDHVVLIYSDFRSALVQEPTAKVLLPFTESVLKEMLTSIGHKHSAEQADEKKLEPTPLKTEYVMEPSAQEIFESILPQLTEMQIYQAVLENAASEHSARMVAMRNATDAAGDLLDDLTMTYNQTRQANITAELAELSAAKAALD